MKRFRALSSHPQRFTKSKLKQI